MKVTLKDLEKAVGTLSNPSKMPGYAWGIPALYCKRGSKLRAKEGTVCSKCYAMKGRYVFPNVQVAQEMRLAAFDRLSRDEWVETMAALIHRRVKPEEPYFRIFDSGDLQNMEMLVRWALVALLLPGIRFWMSTRERAIVNRVFTHHFPQPSNLVVRVSADMVEGVPPKGFKNTSTVSKMDRQTWKTMVNGTFQDMMYYCPAPLQNNECGDCRACWDRGVKTVVYLEH